jgi:hypothetical protein
MKSENSFNLPDIILTLVWFCYGKDCWECAGPQIGGGKCWCMDIVEEQTVRKRMPVSGNN